MTDELLNALKLIKAECEKHNPKNSVNRLAGGSNCKKCPMSNSYEDCGVITDHPYTWELEKREVYF